MSNAVTKYKKKVIFRCTRIWKIPCCFLYVIHLHDSRNVVLTFYYINDESRILIRMEIKHVSYRTISETRTEDWNIVLQTNNGAIFGCYSLFLTMRVYWPYGNGEWSNNQHEIYIEKQGGPDSKVEREKISLLKGFTLYKITPCKVGQNIDLPTAVKWLSFQDN